MRLRIVALAVGCLVACGASEETASVVEEPTNPCTAGLVVNDFGNCVSEEPYACGWKRNNPGALRATGTAEGDVVENLTMFDQCQEKVELWDFYGEYNILWLSAAW